MPARVLVYCKKPVAHLTAEMLLRELRDADLMTLAECLDLPGGEEAAVREMWRHLRMTPETGTLDGLAISWHATQRPIVVEAGPPLPGEIDEMLEHLPRSSAIGEERVRDHLGATREVVGFDMGIDGSLDLAATISEVLAFFVAEQGDGIVWFFGREFAAPDDRCATLWSTEA
ncbi:MAG: hypothetical protein U0166_21440 [Acidobacteriota bacterium]